MTFVLLALGGATATHNATAALIWVKLSMLGTVFVPVAASVHAAMGSSQQMIRIHSTL